MNEIKNRGVNDVFIAVVDGLKGFPEAINAVYPQTSVQTCIVHMIRHSLNYVPWNDRKAVAADLKTIYRAESAEVAQFRLDEFEEKWDHKYPPIGQSWRRKWEQVIPFFAYPEAVRKTIKNRGYFPSGEVATKLLYLAFRNADKKWTMPSRTWKQALNQFAIFNILKMENNKAVAYTEDRIRPIVNDP